MLAFLILTNNILQVHLEWLLLAKECQNVVAVLVLAVMDVFMFESTMRKRTPLRRKRRMLNRKRGRRQWWKERKRRVRRKTKQS